MLRCGEVLEKAKRCGLDENDELKYVSSVKEKKKVIYEEDE